MSQAGFLNDNFSPGGGDIMFLTGNNLLKVGPDAAHEVFLIGTDGITVTGNPGTYTMTIAGNSPTYTVQTLNNTSTALYTLAVAANSAVTVEATIVAAQDDFAESYWGTVVFGARRAGAGAVGVEMSAGFNGTDSAPVVTAYGDVSGNNIRIMVIGQAASTWNWKATIRYVVQS